MLRHADSRLIETVYLDKAMGPVKAAISSLPAFETVPTLPASHSDQRLDQRLEVSTGPDEALFDANGYLIGGWPITTEGFREVVDLAPLGFEMAILLAFGFGIPAKAGEGGRTLDIHVGNVTLYH
jgi:hypothetical protein